MAKKKNESNYSASIVEASRELTAKERVMFKDLGNAIKLNDLADGAQTNGAKAIIDGVADYAIVAIHNEASEDVDYNNYLIIDKAGNKYYTGSTPFWNSFKGIWDEMHESGEEWGIQLNLIPSKNYAGKTVLTCSLI
jgi:hypothetical protein